MIGGESEKCLKNREELEFKYFMNKDVTRNGRGAEQKD